MRLHAKYLSYACKHKLLVSLFFVYETFNVVFCFKPCSILTSLPPVLSYLYKHISTCFKNLYVQNVPRVTVRNF